MHAHPEEACFHPSDRTEERAIRPWDVRARILRRAGGRVHCVCVLSPNLSLVSMLCGYPLTMLQCLSRSTHVDDVLYNAAQAALHEKRGRGRDI